MNATGFHTRLDTRLGDELFDRDGRTALALPVARETGATLWQLAAAVMPALPVVTGALLAVIAGFSLVALGAPIQVWLAPGLVSLAVVMLALAVVQERPGLLLLAAANLAAMVIGSWGIQLGVVALTELVNWHVLLVAAGLFTVPRQPGSRLGLWLGGEFGLFLMVVLLA